MRIAFPIGGAALAALLALPAAAVAEEDNPFAPLPKAEGVEDVASHCAACHSARTFIHLNQSRDWWDDTIDRMKSDHGMWELDAETRTSILDYMEANLGPESD